MDARAVAEANVAVDAVTEAAFDTGPTPEQALISALQRRGKCTAGDLARARKLTADSGDPLRLMLVRLGLVSERDMAAAAAEVTGLELTGSDDYPAAPIAEEQLSLRFLKDARVMPLFETEHALGLAVADPFDDFAPKAIAMATGKAVRLQVGLSTEIQAALERVYEQPVDEDAEAEVQAELGNFSEEDIEHLRDLASEAPVIRLVNQILQRAVESRASDVHIEPFADQLKVRYRVDGILKEGESPPVSSTAAVISRVKIMAKLNIAERRLPQDGRIPQRIQGRELDLRVSTVPTMFGESVVMRLLDKESVSFDFDALGFDGPPRERLIKVLEQPYGIFLVTGPTGSGKSTTLYTALSRLNTEDRKIITVEDPVEYQVAGINQIPVKSAIGMTFAGALRAIVRQDPDIIMVGEMRDLETARIAVQSALTGHVVLSTLHTNDAASGVTRLLDMGVEDYLLTSTINGILAQRLVRRLCPECRQPYTPAPELAAKMREVDRVPARANLSNRAMAAPNAGMSNQTKGKAFPRQASLRSWLTWRSWFSWRQSPVHRQCTDEQPDGADITAPANLKPANLKPDGFKPNSFKQDQPFQLYRAVGCKACNHSGYRGRLVIAEVLLMSDRIRQAVLSHATAGEIHRLAVEEGMTTMYRDGLRKAVDGRTTIEEVIRVAEDN
ncbi:MAG: GspE/PulE family protein [Halochromatium sp.]|uniref:GspE/PulE family protein n=1 Tax=Halochromatium sp. TaxID=2049430 RepID=UPI00397C3F6A